MPRYRRASDDARPQSSTIKVSRAWKTKDCVKHGGHAVDSRATLVGNGTKARLWVEDFGRVDDFTAMCDDSEEAKNEAEAVEDGWRAAEHVVAGESHAVTDEATVVNEGALTRLV